MTSNVKAMTFPARVVAIDAALSCLPREISCFEQSTASPLNGPIWFRPDFSWKESRQFDQIS